MKTQISNILTLAVLLLPSIVFSQVTYLDFTGLSNSTSLSNIAIGGTGETFSANMTRVGTPPNPTVTNNGNIEFRMNSATSEHCINLTFSTSAEVYIDRNTSSTRVFNTRDSLTFDNTSYTETDPSSLLI